MAIAMPARRMLAAALVGTRCGPSSQLKEARAASQGANGW